VRAFVVAVALGWSVSAAAAPLWRLELEALPEYVQGFPLPIALTLTNVSTGTGINDVPGWTPWSVGRAPLTFFFTDGGGKRHEIALPRSTSDVVGESYGPKQGRRMLFDLSLVHGLPPAGAYTLEVVFSDKREHARSKPTRVVIKHASHDDAAAAARLAQGASWGDFVGGNWRTVKAPALSPAAQQQLLLHLFVQRSVYGPEKLAEQPLAWLDPLAHDLFAPEAELYRVELLAARKDPRARAVADALTARTPGLRDAVAAALAGSGELAFLRQSVGAERGDPPGPIPYR
jgi:hypothetical protein